MTAWFTRERGERRMLCVATLVIILGACALISLMWWPMYWYLISEVLPLPANLKAFAIQKRLDNGASEGGVRAGPGSAPPPARAKPRKLTPEEERMQRMRATTLKSGHGVASDPKWQERQPKGVADEDVVEQEYLMSTETMHQIADKDQYIMVTWANNHYYDFVTNWVEHVEDLGISSFVVGAMDNKILAQLVQAGIPCFAMQSGLTSKDYGWGSKNFHAMGRKKIKLVQLFTEMNLTVLISDVDTVWMRNPFEYFKRYPEADILTSSDFLSWTHGDEGLENGRSAGSAYNIGIMMFSPNSQAFAKDWVDWIERDDDVWDQNAFNTLVRKGMSFPPIDHPLTPKRLFWGAEGKLTIGVLPVSLFASGHTFFVSRLHEQLNLLPYVVHATFQYSGTPGKRNRFREFMLWNDPPEYYDPGHGFVTWELDVPEGLLEKAVTMKPSLECCEAQQGHFDLMNHQLLQLRQGLALASSLGLGVIVPQFIAGQDRWWAPHTGRLPGARTVLPYKAPLDHVIDLERGLGRRKPENEFGPDVVYREYSFLDNPRTPAHVKQSIVAVEVCEQESTEEECADGATLARVENGRARIKAGLSDVQVRAALKDVVKEYSVLKFVNVSRAFSRHELESDHEKFVKRTQKSTSIWCCVKPDPGKPGHVWYDMWFDTVPHHDSHNRLWDKPWSIVPGP